MTAVWAVLVLNWAVCTFVDAFPVPDHKKTSHLTTPVKLDLPPPVLVHYAYAGSDTPEDNAHRLRNLEYFIRHAVTSSHSTTPIFRITISGDRPDATELLERYNNKVASGGKMLPPIHVLQRKNEGYDFGAHWDMLQDEVQRIKYSGGPEDLPYSAFIFLNDGVRGPFYPVYMPQDWHWTQAFMDALTATLPQEQRALGDKGAALVGTSIVCLNDDDEAVKQDPANIGPKVEGFAFAMTAPALKHVILHGTSFQNHQTKEDAIINGEYGLTRAVLEAPPQWNVASLLLQHQNMNFRDENTWSCNDKKFPSREHQYGPGISISPLEVIFHKLRWDEQPNVSELDFNFYSTWMDEAADRAKTEK